MEGDVERKSEKKSTIRLSRNYVIPNRSSEAKLNRSNYSSDALPEQTFVEVEASRDSENKAELGLTPGT
jgi:hypothetical protein